MAAVESNEMRSPVITAPNPDPTDRTISVVSEAITALRNELGVRDSAITAHFGSLEKAIEVAHDDLVRVPTEVQKAVGALRELVEQQIKTVVAAQTIAISTHHAETTEKFTSVNNQFLERDTRTDQRAGDTKLAVDAAFAAAKEATAKIEAGFTKQIDGMASTIDTKTANLETRFSDLKERISSIETRSVTVKETHTGMIALAMAGVSIAGLLFTVLTRNNLPVPAIESAVIARQVLQNSDIIARIEDRLKQAGK